MRVLRISLICLFCLIGLLFFIRLLTHTALDDVHPNIPCEDSIIEMSDVLWIIPNFNNYSIYQDKEWLDYIKSKNKTLGMHGVQHTYEEFGENKDFEYINTGAKIFEKSFFEKPAIFKAPQLKLNNFNKNLIENMGIEVKGKWNQLFHKTYHCSDTGIFPNWMIKIF